MGSSSSLKMPIHNLDSLKLFPLKDGDIYSPHVKLKKKYFNLNDCSPKTSEIFQPCVCVCVCVCTMTR